jgi:hypothetical protein
MRRIWAAILCWPVTALAADPALDELQRCMRANLPVTVRIQSVQITAVDRGGTNSATTKRPSTTPSSVSLATRQRWTC